MEIEYRGANCLVISRKKDIFVIDPKLSLVGLKDYSGAASALISTNHELAIQAKADEVSIDGPGEYEVKNCTIKGIATKAHRSSKDDDLSATMYKLDIDDTAIAILGHIDPNLSEDQLESIGVVDILILPVGGYGYTIDPKAAVGLVKKIEPKVVIPTHFDDNSLKYEVQQASFDDFAKELGSEVEEVSKLKLKAGMLPAGLTVYKLAISK